MLLLGTLAHRVGTDLVLVVQECAVSAVVGNHLALVLNHIKDASVHKTSQIIFEVTFY